MIEKILPFVEKYKQLGEEMCDPNLIADINKYKKVAKEHSALAEYAETYERFEKVNAKLTSANEMLAETTDSELVEMAQAEKTEAEAEIAKIEEEARIMLLPRDKNDDSSVYVEVRPAAGGDEASLFGAELFKMYQKYAEKQGWRTEIMEYSETEVGGLKEGVMLIDGVGAYRKLKWESGVHRVQRVPETESQGRIHTSTTTVAVLPEVEDVDFEILDKDIRIDVFRSSGAGGQKVNKTETAIRITHIPTGIVVACQDERSQLKNKERAFSILKSKLYDHYKSIADSEYASNRKSQVGTGDRCERIRTYNYPQGRVTDHRINLTVYNLEDFLDGNIEFMCDELNRADQKAKLESQT